MDHDEGNDTENLSEFVVEILRYVVAHPSAKDTVSGIEKWWLPRRISREGKRKIEESLELLVSKGWLIERGSPQSETIYSLNENGLEKIKDFLNEKN
jgi:hypothetical protein